MFKKKRIMGIMTKELNVINLTVYESWEVKYGRGSGKKYKIPDCLQLKHNLKSPMTPIQRFVHFIVYTLFLKKNDTVPSCFAVFFLNSGGIFQEIIYLTVKRYSLYLTFDNSFSITYSFSLIYTNKLNIFQKKKKAFTQQRKP